MNNKVLRASGMWMVMTVATPAAAQTAGPIDQAPTAAREMHVSAALVVGTLGIGPEVGLRFSDHLGVRANATFLGVNASPSSDDIEYDAKLKLKSYGAMVDLYPFGGKFRISGGARINRNRASLDANLTGETTIDVGDTTYTAAQVGTLSGRARVKKFAPALTLGWAGSNRRGFFLGFEAGALFQGAVRIREFTATGTLRNDPNFKASLERERVSLQKDVDDYKVYPILMSSIGFRF